MAKKMNLRGQVMIWVILAVLLVASIMLFFFIDSGPRLTTQDELDIDGFIEQCARKHVNDAVDIMLPHGGFLEPKNFKVYNDIEVEYLCENIGNYESCVNQHPMLINEIRDEIKNYVEPRIEGCFSEWKSEIESRNGEVSLGVMELSVSLAPDRIFLGIEREVNINRKGESQSFERFDVEIINPVYDLTNVAIEIASQEAKYCYFEYVGYMILYPRFDIKVFTLSDSTSIYTIKDKNTRKEINIAIRGCAIPPGI